MWSDEVLDRDANDVDDELIIEECIRLSMEEDWRGLEKLDDKQKDIVVRSGISGLEILCA